MYALFSSIVRKWLGLITVLIVFACTSPRKTTGDPTLNQSRVKGNRYTTGPKYATSYTPKNKAKSNDRFLDALESGSESKHPAKSTGASASLSVKGTETPTGTVKPAPVVEEAGITGRLVSEADKLLGVKYRYAGDSPGRGFDCSGFTCYVFRKADVHLPRTSTDQSRLGKRKKFEQAEVGDLVFFGTGSRVTHVAVVVARTRDTMKIAHSTSSSGVRYDEVFSSRYWNSRKLWAVDHRSLID